MRRHLIFTLLCAFALTPVWAPVASGAESQGISLEAENPINDQGSSYDYRSYITSVTPKVPGLHLEVLEFADRILLRNETGKTVTVYGYSGEPYARVQPDGATEENVRSPAVYLNTNFYGDVTVPASASAAAPPKWVVIDRTGELEWHDHRIHWMSPIPPTQVKDKSKVTKIFDWRVPIMIGSQRGAIEGDLFWVPDSSKAPAAAIVVLIVLTLLSIVFVVVMRRRRAQLRAPGVGAESGPDADTREREAW